MTPVQPRHPLALLADGWEARARLLTENARAEQSEQSARYYAARAAEAQDCAAQLREALRAQAAAAAGLREAAQAIWDDAEQMPGQLRDRPDYIMHIRCDLLCRLRDALAQAGGESL